MKFQFAVNKIASHLGYLILPFLFMSFFILIFAILGLSMFEEQVTAEEMEKLGGSDLWYFIFNVYLIMILLLFGSQIIKGMTESEVGSQEEYDVKRLRITHERDDLKKKLEIIKELTYSKTECKYYQNKLKEILEEDEE